MAEVWECGHYERNPAEIYRRSFEIIEREANLGALPVSLRAIARRIVHACGMPSIVEQLSWSGSPADAATVALAEGRSVFCDASMIRSGIIAPRMQKAPRVVVTVRTQTTRKLARELGTTRSAAAVQLWGKDLEGAVVAIGNAPTALFHLIDLLKTGHLPRPAVIFAFPVGFVGAAESKVALCDANLGVPYLTLLGRLGGSAMAAAAINAVLLDCT